MTFQPPMPPYASSDPSAVFVGTSCLDFLLIEMVPMSYRVTNELETQALEQTFPPVVTSNPAGAGPDRTSTVGGLAGTSTSAAGKDGGGGSSGGGGGVGSVKSTAAGTTVAGGGGAAASSVAGTMGMMTRKMDEDEERDAVFYRLEMLGYRVGQGLAERFSRDRPRFHDTLDIIKFLCKDLWIAAFRKQVDNLRTNHRGVYVLTDNSFRPLTRMSTDTGGQALLRAQPFLWFPCGLVRGALAALGINATVQAESSELPSAIFQIKTVASGQ